MDKYYLRVEKEKETDVKYLSIVNLLVNEVLESDIQVSEEIYTFILATPLITVLEDLNGTYESLEEFKKLIRVDTIKVEEIKESPTAIAISGLMQNNALLMQELAKKNIIIEQLQKDISSLMITVANITVPKIIKE